MNQITNTNHLILLEAAKKLKLTSHIIQSQPPIIEITYQQKTHRLSEKSLGINTSQKAKTISKNKALTLKTLQATNLPTPKFYLVTKRHDYKKALKSVSFPQVIKPLTGEKGKNIFLNIKNQKTGQKAVNQILDHYPEGCIIESFHLGNDYRFMVLNFKLIGLSQRLSPTITSDGLHTVKQLILLENRRRFQQSQKLGKRLLNRMRNWPRIKWNLAQQNLTLKTILEKGKTITLYPIPNFSTGGSVKAIDIKTVHPSLINLAQQTAQAINLEIIGIDMLIKDLNKPPKNNTVIIEVNSDPGLRLHDWPNQGKPQHVAEKILKYIFKL
jgi:cyanophycin synthetase